ncbi:MAG: hypothetical protein JJ863_01760 [Deltaproteobacteria bacterium]|nr:hypothetical protein [Deltaproteobacteria bacterium]
MRSSTGISATKRRRPAISSDGDGSSPSLGPTRPSGPPISGLNAAFTAFERSRLIARQQLGTAAGSAMQLPEDEVRIAQQRGLRVEWDGDAWSEVEVIGLRL